ncbi:hypothetical protein D918_09880 [Trichuris suis]|nr:hypothetical protein D918_09880 [Trichuris suis]
MKKQDPAQGKWDVSGDNARVWVDASGLALGVALEAGGSIIEDASWLRPDDAQHINMVELDAVIRGLNLALSWRMKSVELMTDSSTVKEDQPEQVPYLVGDKVWVRPPDVRCDCRYRSGTITDSLSRHAVYVDGTPRHVRDLRRRTSEESPSERLQTEASYDDLAGPSAARVAPSDEDPEAGQGALRRSSRLRKARSLHCSDS